MPAWEKGAQANQRLTTAQAAVRLGISEGALRSRIKRGTTPTVKEVGRGPTGLRFSPTTDNTHWNAPRRLPGEGYPGG